MTYPWTGHTVWFVTENSEKILAISWLFVLLTIAASAPDRGAGMPNSHLTPGAVASTDTSAICRSGYATRIRPRGSLWRSLKDAAYDRYGLPRGHRSVVDDQGVRRPAYAVDHLVPLELGGAPANLANLWPEPIASAKQKDRVENELHDRVCAGRMSLRQAQNAIARDWKTAVPGLVIP